MRKTMKNGQDSCFRVQDSTSDMLAKKSLHQRAQGEDTI
jgi:hypothetical protein